MFNASNWSTFILRDTNLYTKKLWSYFKSRSSGVEVLKNSLLDQQLDNVFGKEQVCLLCSEIADSFCWSCHLNKSSAAQGWQDQDLHFPDSRTEVRVCLLAEETQKFLLMLFPTKSIGVTETILMPPRLLKPY